MRAAPGTDFRSLRRQTHAVARHDGGPPPATDTARTAARCRRMRRVTNGRPERACPRSLRVSTGTCAPADPGRTAPCTGTGSGRPSTAGGTGNPIRARRSALRRNAVCRFFQENSAAQRSVEIRFSMMSTACASCISGLLREICHSASCINSIRSLRRGGFSSALPSNRCRPADRRRSGLPR